MVPKLKDTWDACIYNMYIHGVNSTQSYNLVLHAFE